MTVCFSLKPDSHKENPWFKEYWEQIFNCTFSDEMTLRYRGTFNECSGNETFDEYAGSIINHIKHLFEDCSACTSVFIPFS